MQRLGNVGDGITTGTKVQLHGVIEDVLTLGGCPAYRVRYDGDPTQPTTQRSPTPASQETPHYCDPKRHRWRRVCAASAQRSQD